MEPLLEADLMSKRLTATQALDAVSFSLEHGEVHVSHHRLEIFAIADRIPTLHDGRGDATDAADQADAEAAVREMAGREIRGAAALLGAPAGAGTAIVVVLSDLPDITRLAAGPGGAA